MSDDEIMSYTKEGAEQLNRQLNIGLSNDGLIRSGYKKLWKASDELAEEKPEYNPPIDPDNIKRNENDVSFNYSRNTFDSATEQTE